MKKVLLYFVFMTFGFAIQAQYTAIPDANFENALAVYDDIANDGQVPTTNIISLTSLDVSNSNISDLTGIESFVALETLLIHDNNISTLDVSDLVNLITLRVTRNQLTTLDLSQHPVLETLIADSNDLTTLQISSTVLKYLQVFNNSLVDINLNNFVLLEQLFVGRNDLTRLDVSNNPSLFRIEFPRTHITTLDVSSLSGLRFLIGFDSDLRFVNVKNGNNTAIEDLQLQNNPNLQCIQVDNEADANAGAGNYAAWQIDAATSAYADQCFTSVPDDNFEQALIDAGYDSGTLDNVVPTANIVSVERFVAGSGGQLFNRGIVNFTGIEDFVALIQLSSTGNPATSIDLSENTNLEIIGLNGTTLSSLDLSANLKLSRVSIIDTQLQTLDLGTNTVLSTLSIDSPLTGLDVSANTALMGLSISNSQLSNLDVSNNVALTRLSLDTAPLAAIDLSANTSLTDLTINNSALGSLDVSANTVLDYLECMNNQLTQLDVSNNTLLEELYFSDNQISSLDVSANITLEYLYGNNNNLTNLDLSSNTVLEELEVKNNQLTLLNLKNSNNLSTLSYVSVLMNTNLTCIEVDDETAANAGTGNYRSWDKDATASYAEICTDCGIDGDVRIASQVELDAFLAQLGSCKTINGSLIIRNSNDITDLSGLAGVEVINGKLVLGDNDLLPNLTGLHNLRTLTDGIAFFRNDVLTDITALSGIVDPIANFSISDNPLLTDISSIMNITVTELLRVDDQALTHPLVFPNVTTLTGANTFNSSGPGSLIFTDVVTSTISVPNLTMVENFFTLRNVDAGTVSLPMLVSTGRSFNLFNVNSTTLNFDAVQSLGSFTIDETQLTDLSDFGTVTAIGSSINILRNPNLTTLEALSNVATTTDVFLNVSDNDVLVNLDGLDFISGATEFLVLERNTALSNIDALKSVTSTRYFRIIDNTVLANVSGLQNLTEITETDMSPFLQSTISGNAITSLNLTDLRTVGNQLNIIETGVTNFCGLYSYVADGDGQTTLNLTGSSFTIGDILNCENVAPTITLIGANPQVIEAGSSYIELGATADDGSTVVINASAVNTNIVGSYEVTYNATNASGMASAIEVTRTVDVLDITAPVITLIGDNPQEISLGAGYTELGATADDGTAVVIDATDFVDAVGSYTIRYNATDASGNRATEITRTVNVIDTCPLSNLSANNFAITAASETCVDKDNGIINITATAALDYTTTINDVDYSFTSSLEVGDLPPGTYPICIGVAGFANCEQCFEVVIADEESLEGKTELITQPGMAKVRVEVTTGTGPYTATINNEVVGVYTTKNFLVDVVHGDTLEVSSSLDCEGKLLSNVSLFDQVSITPNPTRSNVTLTLPNSKAQTINVTLYNGLGVQVSSKKYSIISGQVLLPMEQLPQGIYFVKLEEGGTFKIVKQ
ncbi:DUF5011 domain-containing protein [Aquimarina sp. D1M17]|uniref:immunoglobulin-like domain-containing protein n=1 Tax=Aquimarina acroporae TaxID=2937283 RepID=UPI0020C0CFB3|nr:immunoglobulin-like domain-containing protein [Aquimarina acroporae]MCK8523803.1 DUF5011 domain-containing protein [Aquimarina acroporae]